MRSNWKRTSGNGGRAGKYGKRPTFCELRRTGTEADRSEDLTFDVYAYVRSQQSVAPFQAGTATCAWSVPRRRSGQPPNRMVRADSRETRRPGGDHQAARAR